MRYNSFMTAKTPKLLRVLLIPEGRFWVAQGIDKDIAAQGLDPDGARRAFLKTLAAQIRLDLERGREPLAAIKEAPDWYFQAYEEAEELPTLLHFPQQVHEADDEVIDAPLYIPQAMSEQRPLTTM